MKCHSEMLLLIAVLLMSVRTNALTSAENSTVIPPTISLLSAPNIDASCMRPADGIDSEQSRRCRTIVLGIEGGEFPAPSLALTAVVQNRLVVPAGDSKELAFGIASRWSQVADDISVSTVREAKSGLRRYMFIQMPRTLYLDLSVAERLFIRTDTPDIVQSFTPSATSRLEVNVVPSRDVSVDGNIVAAGILSGVCAAMTSLTSLSPTIPELQYFILLTSSRTCGLPHVRSLSQRLLRVVFPSVSYEDTDDPVALARRQLLHNFLIVFFASILHIFFILLIKVYFNWNWFRAAAVLYFPSALFSIFLILLPGTVHASTKLLLYPRGSAATSLSGVAGFVYVAIVSVCAVIGLPRLATHIVTRRVESHLVDFPKFLQLAMPSTLWGPRLETRSFTVPVCFADSQLVFIRLAQPFAVPVAFGFLTAIEPASASGCGIWAVAMATLILTVPVLVTIRPMFRSKTLANIGLSAMIYLILPTMTFLVRGFQPEAVTLAETPLIAMLNILIGVTLVRALLTGVVFFLERTVVYSRTWTASAEAVQRSVSEGPREALQKKHPDTSATEMSEAPALPLRAADVSRIPSRRDEILGGIGEWPQTEAQREREWLASDVRALEHLMHRESKSFDFNNAIEFSHLPGAPRRRRRAPSTDRAVVLGAIPELDPVLSRRLRQGSPEAAAPGDAAPARVRFNLNASTIHPLSHVIAGRGPMPPALAQKQRAEYDML